MSTQRRENRCQRKRCTDSAEARGVPGDRFSSLEQRASGPVRSAPIARQCRVSAHGGTAQPRIAAGFHPSDKDLSPGTPEYLATNSLHTNSWQSDCRLVQFVHFALFVQLVQLVQVVGQDIRIGSPPPRVERRTKTRAQATHRASLPRIPFPSGFSRHHPTLPRVPASASRRAERYDGKRDLHLLYAA